MLRFICCKICQSSTQIIAFSLIFIGNQSCRPATNPRTYPLFSFDLHIPSCPSIYPVACCFPLSRRRSQRRYGRHLPLSDGLFCAKTMTMWSWSPRWSCGAYLTASSAPKQWHSYPSVPLRNWSPEWRRSRRIEGGREGQGDADGQQEEECHCFDDLPHHVMPIPQGCAKKPSWAWGLVRTSLWSVRGVDMCSLIK